MARHRAPWLRRLGAPSAALAISTLPASLARASVAVAISAGVAAVVVGAFAFHAAHARRAPIA